MEYFLGILLAGFLGGAVRGIVGIIKHTLRFKNTPLRPWYFGGMTLASGAIGVLAAWIAKDLGVTFVGGIQLSPAVAVVIGYAGGDFMENIFKIIAKKPDLFTFPQPK